MQAQMVTFSNDTKIRVMVQIFAGRDDVSTAFVDANSSTTISAESHPYDIYCKDVVSGGELSHLLASSYESISLLSNKGNYVIKGEAKLA